MHLPLWIEMRVNDPEMLTRRFRRDKLFSIEYMGYNSETALNDFHQRIQYQLKEY